MMTNTQSHVIASAPEPLVDGNHRMAPDPEATELLQSQVILPFSLGSVTHAFLGALLTPKEVQKTHSFFPCAVDQTILASQEEICIKQFVLAKRSFRNPPENILYFIS